jgi:hypothetical protein
MHFVGKGKEVSNLRHESLARGENLREFIQAVETAVGE